MATLTEQLSQLYTNIHSTIPKEILDKVKTMESEHSASFDVSKAAKAGDKLPDFKSRMHSERKGNIVLFFYRGEWCPYCNLELRALQKIVPELAAKGTTLVAVSPELPHQAFVTSQKNELTFPVLSDLGNGLARQLGIVFKQPDTIKDVLGFWGGLDWKAHCGDESYEVPVPATILIDKTGTIRNTFIDPQWTKRLEPATVLKWIDEL
ncbi:hypothetical protein M422DRAFT_261560 [Sphaerobolus stellatus SS14]|uniref:thioredoxin-dependent peroxiredoxin n=1 Tax=Sphaerobolus stellatus (strain SS14) TaxID=990650 RepID=A0A0C9VF17_SPHS4|nr:hypothetical protein M422DRAFT_261560 [Sphaerobolus stellatus SS14]